MDLIKAYGYITQRLASGTSVAVTYDKAVKRYGEENADTVQQLLNSAIQAFSAAANMMTLPPNQPIDLSIVPSVPGTVPGVTYVYQIWHNPGEYIWAIQRGGRSVSLQDLELLARGALALWQRNQSESESPLQTGQGITVYRGSKVDVPPGFFRVLVSRIEQEYLV